MNTAVKKQSIYPLYISILLVIALGASVAKLMWLIMTPEQQISTTAASNSSYNPVNTTKTKQRNFGKIISEQHLFGEVKKETIVNKTPIATTKTAVAPTKLNLKLHGIVAYKNKAGYALISSNGGSQKVYGKGDTIEQEITLSDLLPDKVLINNHGTIQELILPRKSANKTSEIPFSLLPPAEQAFIKRRDQINKARFAPKAANLAKFRKEIIKNPKKLFDVATPSPAVVNGKFIGFRLQPGSNRKMFRQIGLRANDIITSVNGIILDDPSKGVMVLGELSQASSVSITVRRGDETLTLSQNFTE